MTYLTAEQLAERLGVCPRTIFRMERRGDMPKGIRFSKKLIRWAQGDIDAWFLAQGDSKPAKKSGCAKSKAIAAVDTTLFKISDSLQINIRDDLIKSWADTYPQEFLSEEMKKARNWILCNLHKAPKSNWGRFFNSWFARGWEAYRKAMASAQPTITDDDVKRIMHEIGEEDARDAQRRAVVSRA